MEKEDGDSVGQVKWEGDGKSSRRPVRWERERFKGIKARREVGHASTSGLSSGFTLRSVDFLSRLVAFTCALSLKFSSIISRFNSISNGYVNLTILEERFVGRIWDIDLILIGEFFKGFHSAPVVTHFGPTPCLFLVWSPNFTT
jgi:hypothetical protein